MLQETSLTVGSGPAARAIAVLHRPGERPPGLFWLGGFRSDMAGTKAEALDGWGAAKGHAVTRFDYSGHGSSGGDFRDGTISRWLEEALAVLRRFTEGPQIVVGSSMGGWIALLLARALREAGEAERIGGLMLIAPALDMTHDLMAAQFTEAEHRMMRETGRVEQPSDYSDEPYVLTRALIEDGKSHLFGAGPIEVGAPVDILQGGRDTDVPPEHAHGLMERLIHDDATLTLVEDGDHRLSRSEDLALLIRKVEAMAERISASEV